MAGPSQLFGQVSTGRVSEQIVVRIGDAIRDGTLAAGDRLPPERQLAERFGVSRVTVRDALRSLEVLGLVEIRVGAGGGPVVRSPDVDVVRGCLSTMLMTSRVDATEIAEARLLLDLGSVALAAGRATEEDLDELQVMVETARRNLRDGSYSPESAGQWHVRLAEASHNPAVVLVVGAIRGPLAMSAVRRHGTSTGDSHERTIEDHAAILDALRDRDRARAQGLMASHLLQDRRSPGQVRDLLVTLGGGAWDGLDEVLATI